MPKQRTKKRFTEGVAIINATFNNTLITITDPSGKVLCWGSAGNAGFKNARKSTPYAAQVAAEKVAVKAKEYGIKEIAICVKGPGAGRDPAARALANEMTVVSLEDATPLPHNGPRARKKRRV